MKNGIVHPPHVLARIERRRIGFERDLRRTGFSISTNCGYRLLDDGETLLILDFMPHPQERERSPYYPIRYWPAPCRIMRIARAGERPSDWNNCSLDLVEERKTWVSVLKSSWMTPGGHVPDIPVARQMEAEMRSRLNLAAIRPWKLLRSGYMKGPPLFDDFVFEWTSPLSILIEIPDRKAGWL